MITSDEILELLFYDINLIFRTTARLCAQCLICSFKKYGYMKQNDHKCLKRRQFSKWKIEQFRLTLHWFWLIGKKIGTTGPSWAIFNSFVGCHKFTQCIWSFCAVYKHNTLGKKSKICPLPFLTASNTRNVQVAYLQFIRFRHMLQIFNLGTIH